jgi:hypothetical protein
MPVASVGADDRHHRQATASGAGSSDDTRSARRRPQHARPSRQTPGCRTRAPARANIPRDISSGFTPFVPKNKLPSWMVGLAYCLTPLCARAADLYFRILARQFSPQASLAIASQSSSNARSGWPRLDSRRPEMVMVIKRLCFIGYAPARARRSGRAGQQIQFGQLAALCAPVTLIEAALETASPLPPYK